MRNACAMLSSMALLAACTDRLPAPINPSVLAPTTPPPAPPAATFTISGVVRAAAVPVEGARIVVVDQGLPSTLTDRNGFYTISGVRPAVDSISPLLSAQSGLFY
jgi:hypothetical protein